MRREVIKAICRYGYDLKNTRSKELDLISYDKEQGVKYGIQVIQEILCRIFTNDPKEQSEFNETIYAKNNL